MTFDEWLDRRVDGQDFSDDDVMREYLTLLKLVRVLRQYIDQISSAEQVRPGQPSQKILDRIFELGAEIARLEAALLK